MEATVPFKHVRFTNKKVAQEFLDKFEEADRDIFIVAPFTAKSQKEYWGLAIVATNKDEELEGYATFIKYCNQLGLRPRFVFLNRIDAKLIKDDNIEKVGLPWIANPEGSEIPIDILEPISDEDISDEGGEGNEPNIAGEDFEEPTTEPAEGEEDLVKEEGYDPIDFDMIAEDYDYMDGQPLREDVIPINKSGLADGRFGAVRKYATKKKNVEEVQLIDLGTGDAEPFVEWFKTYADENKIKEGTDYSIVGDIVKILKHKLDNEIVGKMQEFGVKLKESQLEEEPVEDIEEFDIPKM
jgi:hypothetical protein